MSGDAQRSDKKLENKSKQKDFPSGLAQMVKRLSPMWQTRVRALGWEDPLEKEMEIHSSTLAWRIPWTKDPGGLHSP